jgi:hypothetical protein
VKYILLFLVDVNVFLCECESVSASFIGWSDKIILFLRNITLILRHTFVHASSQMCGLLVLHSLVSFYPLHLKAFRELLLRNNDVNLENSQTRGFFTPSFQESGSYFITGSFFRGHKKEIEFAMEENHVQNVLPNQVVVLSSIFGVFE